MSKKSTFRDRESNREETFLRIMSRRSAPLSGRRRRKGASVVETVSFLRWISAASIPTVVMALALLGLSTLGCEAAFEPFNGVDEFRVLSLQAEPPVLAEGDRAVVTPLIHTTDDAPVRYKWSWCPIAASSKDGGGCIIDEETLRDILESLAADQVGAEAAALLENFAFSFDLGDGSNAQFFYAIPAALLSNLCEQLISEEIPSFTGIPQCDSHFDVVVRLEATQGETTLQAVKKIPLYIDGSRATNRNPFIDGVAVLNDSGKSAKEPLVRGRWYDVLADISEEVIDNYSRPAFEADPSPAPVKEVLFMTWYVTGGKTDFMRTTYIDGEVPFEALKANRWRIPSVYDYPNDVITLFLVLQDEQGGVGWLVRDFELKEE